VREYLRDKHMDNKESGYQCRMADAISELSKNDQGMLEDCIADLRSVAAAFPWSITVIAATMLLHDVCEVERSRRNNGRAC